MNVTSLTNVVYTQCRTNIESTLIQRYYLESALTQCQFIAARTAEVRKCMYQTLNSLFLKDINGYIILRMSPA